MINDPILKMTDFNRGFELLSQENYIEDTRLYLFLKSGIMVTKRIRAEVEYNMHKFSFKENHYHNIWLPEISFVYLWYRNKEIINKGYERFRYDIA